MNKKELSAMVAELLQSMQAEPAVKDSGSLATVRKPKFRLKILPECWLMPKPILLSFLIPLSMIC